MNFLAFFSGQRVYEEV